MPLSRANILFVSSRADSGAGGENYLLQVMRHLDRERFRPIVVLPGEGSLRAPLEKMGVEVVVVEAGYGWIGAQRPWYRYMAKTRDRVYRLVDLIKEKHIDLVHTNSNFHLEGALGAQLAGVHHLYLAHIELQPEVPLFQRLSLDPASYAALMGQLSTRIVAVSRSVADRLSPPVPSEKIQIIHNGLDMEVFDAAMEAADGSLRAELGVEDNSLLVTALGRVCPDKGFDYYLEAASRVLSSRPNVHFLLVGGDEHKKFASDLRAQAQERDIKDHFHFLGFRDDVPRILAESDIFVLSSRREGHPYVLLEAMACGCAVVASRCAGVEETVMEGKTGRTTEVGDVEAISASIISLIDDPELRKTLGMNAFQDIRERFTASTSVEGLMAAYEEILALPSPPSGSPAVTLFLQAAREIGDLGLHVTDVQERLRQVEHVTNLIKENPIARAARRVVHRWRAFKNS
ncbi:MAG: glycosyltransferase family 4 protein [Deltaproteobacteria bacterium]|nr:glycosyltransferase family 4 protein [Deltaproteobacteria bacterium]